MDFPLSEPLITIHSGMEALFPEIHLGWLVAGIRNRETPDELWRLITARTAEIQRTLDEEGIRHVAGIQAGKRAYRELGKDPNRYRLSAESLMRRAVKGKGLYSISAAVDSLNLVSLRTGITIGGFDGQSVRGGIELGIGRQGEAFTAIGRGDLNVENLPVYRDETGAIGNPTSDCERTRITRETRQILMLITGFYGDDGIEAALNQLKDLLVRFCEAESCLTGIIRKQ